MARRRRRRLDVELTDEALDGIDALATRHHVTKTTMVEALGRLGRTAGPVVWDDVIDLARSIDTERRSRR